MATKKKVVKSEPKWAEGLTKLERKRVETWKDVVARIKAKKVVVEEGTYLDSDLRIADVPQGEEIELQSLLPKMGTCRACAKGALFLSHVDRFDRCKLVVTPTGCSVAGVDYMTEVNPADGIGYGEEMVGAGNRHIMATLKGTFTPTQLDLVECAFELGMNEHSLGAREYDKAQAFGEMWGDSESRLLAIAKNAIKNRGKFVPPPIKEK